MFIHYIVLITAFLVPTFVGIWITAQAVRTKKDILENHASSAYTYPDRYFDIQRKHPNFSDKVP